MWQLAAKALLSGALHAAMINFSPRLGFKI